MRVARKEAKESTYWLELIMEVNGGFNHELDSLIQESKELRNIFTAIIEKASNS